MLKKLTVYKAEDIPGDWKDRLLVLWQEDDVNYSDKETTASAFSRITGLAPRTTPLHEIDEGDVSFYFYRGGWVRCSSYDGGFVGVLVAKE